ncbi:MAG: hypothetical protein KJ063_23375 [Anaerolineae bacterium]|nr:hypothetical protein [Anaerolineae bacterium]
MSYSLQLCLLSDATFGRGEGVAGLVDAEIEYDVPTGLPFVRGRTLKGLLVEECSNILFSLDGQAHGWHEAARFLFGQPGSTLDDQAMLHIGPAILPDDLRRAVKAEIEAKQLTADQVLNALTGIRRQTAIDEGRGAPREGSLRAMRVLLTGTRLNAALDFREPPSPEATALLAACTSSVRRAGLGRNRGSGRLKLTLWQDGQEVTATHLAHFRQQVQGGAS